MDIIDTMNYSNKELIESLFTQIENDLGYHIINKLYGDCYFIFEGEEDSVCHFKIKEIPGFTFALWNTNRFDNPDLVHRNVEKDDELVFFTQYDINMDKFKPSRSGFVQGLHRDAELPNIDDEKEKKYKGKQVYLRKDTWNLYKLEDILYYMKHHPIKSVFYITSQIEDIYCEKSGLFCLKNFIEDWYYHFKYKIQDWLKLNITKLIVNYKLKKLDKLDDIKYIFIQRSSNWHPRLDLIFSWSDNITDENYNKLDKIIDFLEKYFYMNVTIEYGRIKYNEFNSKNNNFIKYWTSLNINSEDYEKGEKLIKYKGV